MSENNMTNHSKSRVLMLLAIAAVVVGSIVFVWRHAQNKRNAQASVSVSGAPSIQSVPGAGNPSAQYVQDQNLQNQINEQKARKAGTSAVPTITRSSFVGNPGEFAQDIPNADSQAPAQCSLKKVVVMFKPNPASCSLDNLKMARKTGVTAEELACQGCPTSLLRLAGYTAGDLKNIGYTAKQLKAAGFSDADLKDAGFSDKEIQGAKNAFIKPGLSSAELLKGGLNAAALRKAGFTAAELKAAGFSDADLKAAGYSAKDLAEAAKISPGSHGLTAAELKAHGFTAAQLKKMGFTAAQLKAAGFSADELKKAGFGAKALKDAGFTAAELKAAGFTPEELKAAGFTAGQLKAAGVSAEALKAAGFTPEELRSAGFDAAELRHAGYSPEQLRAAGYTRGDLLRGGYSPIEAGYAKKSSPGDSAGNYAGNGNGNGNGNAASRNAALNNFSAQNPNNDGNNSSLPSMTANSPEARLAEVARLQQQQMNAQQKQDYIAQQQGAMTMQAQKLLAGWSNHSNQTLAQAPVDKSARNSANNAGNLAGAGSVPIIKAGTVLFAVLDTGINSDNSSPIMAHVVSGALKGAKLLGKFTRINDRVLLSFYLVNDPRYPNSIGINAVAIDPDTAHTAMADSVNYHYMLRYGSLFASAFVEGLSDAVIANHSTTACGLFGCQQFANGNLSTKDEALMAVGKVGQQYSSQASNNFNTPPTVKVAAGSGLGILFMSDVQMPAQAQINNTQVAVKSQLLSLNEGK